MRILVERPRTSRGTFRGTFRGGALGLVVAVGLIGALPAAQGSPTRASEAHGPSSPVSAGPAVGPTSSARTSPGSPGSPGRGTAVRAGLRGLAVWPLHPDPEVRAGFVRPPAPWAPGHRGVDLASRAGQRVRSALAGRVAFAGRIAGRGVVVVDHGALRTTYEPVEAAVRVGELVDPGQSLGTIELFGSHCWPQWCLHWGLIEGTTYLDPLGLLGLSPVRLVPWEGLGG